MIDIILWLLGNLFYLNFEDNDFWGFNTWYENESFHQEANPYLKYTLMTLGIFAKICEFCICNYFFI